MPRPTRSITQINAMNKTNPVKKRTKNDLKIDDP